MNKVIAIGAFAWLVLAGFASGQTRSEVPIRETILSDGTRRYAVEIKVGDTVIEAGLDSGSTGLRILPNTLRDGDAKTSDDTDDYDFGAGVRLQGRIGTGTLSIGQLSGTSPFQQVENIGCTADKPHCGASRVPPDQFGIQGDGLPGEGFRALLGTSMASASVQNPLSAIGIKRWIIELPRPGSHLAGKLVLNPDDAETKDFTMLPLLSDFRRAEGVLHDAVGGCIANQVTGDGTCGPLTLDNGAPGIWVTNGDLGETPWPNETAAALTFFAGDQPVAAEKITIGRPAHGSHLSFEHKEHARRVIHAGLAPYFAFDVLYSPDENLIGLRPRPPEPGSPVGVVVDRSASPQ